MKVLIEPPPVLTITV